MSNTIQPKISIVMSVYNGSFYLRESIESILNQTFVDFEFIIINDCSTDNSWEVMNKYAERDLRIILINNPANIGLTKSLNKGLKIAGGEYIARQDADDISLPDRLKIQANFLDFHPEVGVLGSNAKAIDEQGQYLGACPIPIEHENTIEHESLQAYLLVNNCLYHSSLIARRSLIQKIGGYDEELRYAQDYKLWWDLGQLSRLASLPDNLILVRKSDNNITTKNRLEQLLCSLKISLQAVEESLKGQSLDKDTYQKFWWAYLQLIDRKAYEGFWPFYHSRHAQLTSKDIQHLQPLWNLLANQPSGSRVWGSRLQDLAYHLLRRGQTREGLQLIQISSHRLKVPIQWNKTIRALVKPYLPEPGQQLWKIWKTRRINVHLHNT